MSKKQTGIRTGTVMAATAGMLFLLQGCISVDTAYVDPWHAKDAAAGITEKHVRIGDVELDYAEGPDNGPALLLLHAQHMDWYSYSRVLPELSRDFHVFAVSYHGHGTTTSPADRLDAAHIGADLGTFIETVIGEPAFVTGNSSGGLLTTWLAANRPDLVKGILLEDPPLFTAELPRAKKTVAYRTFTTCHSFLEAHPSGDGDFLRYWLETNRNFVVRHAGENGLQFLKDGIAKYRAANPGKPVELNLLPDILRLFVRDIDMYDPRFGNNFHDGSWNAGFDHAEALSRIACPALLLHADFSYMEDGTLDGALDDDDAKRVMSLLKNGQYRRIDAAHTVHIDKPEEFVRIAREFFLGK